MLDDDILSSTWGVTASGRISLGRWFAGVLCVAAALLVLRFIFSAVPGVLPTYPDVGDGLDVGLAVVPVLVGPLQVLLAVLPGLLLALGSALLSIFKPRVMWAALKLLWRQKIAVACVTAVVVGLWYGLAWLLPASSGPVSAAEVSSDAWTMFRGNARRSGAVDGAPGPTHGGVNWAFTRDTGTFYATPALIGNRVYIPSVADIGPFNRDGNGAVYCLDADTGGVVWKSAPAGYRATFSSPAVSGRYLVCGEGLHLVTDARVICLDLERNGQLVWQYRTNSHVESSPCIHKGRVYIGAGDDGYYCLDLAPDADGAAKVLWHVGTWFFEPDEILDWPGLLAALRSQAAVERPSPGRRLFERLPDGLRAELSAFDGGEPDPGLKSRIIDGLNMVLERSDLFDEEAWAGVDLDIEVRKILSRVKAGEDRFVDFLTTNRILIETAFPDAVKPRTRYLDAETSPLVVSVAADGGQADRVYAGLGMGGKAVVCLDAETGHEVWRQPTPYPVFGPPSFVDGRIFVGMGNGNFVQKAENAAVFEINKLRDGGGTEEQIEKEAAHQRPGGAVWCLDARGGSIQWKFPVERTVLGAVTAGAEGLYFGSRDGRVYLLSYDGEEKAGFDCHAAVVTSPALTKDHVYFVTETGRLCGLTADTLESVWETSLGKGAMFISSPSVARGHVYVGTDMGGLLCLGSPGRKEPPVWAGAFGGPGRPGYVEATPLPARSKYIWRYPPKPEDADAPEPQALIVAPAACTEGRLFVPVADGDRKGLACLTLKSGDSDTPAEDWFFQAPGGVSISPAATADRVFMVDGKAGGEGRHLYCLDAASGVEKWKTPLGREASGRFIISKQGFVFLEREGGLLSCLDFDGRDVWSRRTGALAGPPDCSDAMLFVAAGPPDAAGSLSALDLFTGTPLWSLSVSPTTGPVFRGNRIFLGTAQGVAAHSALDGGRIWLSEGGHVATRLALLNKRIACINSSSALLVLDSETGAILAAAEDADPAVPPLLARSGVVFQGENDLMIYDFQQGEVRRWMRSKWLGQVTGPLIMSGSAVFFATDKKGLVCAREK